ISDTTDAVLAITSTTGTPTGNVTVTVNDGTGNTTPATFQVQVQTDTVNDPPILNPVTNTVTPVGTPVVITPTATDPDGGGLTFTVRVLPNANNVTNGTVADN